MDGAPEDASCGESKLWHQLQNLSYSKTPESGFSRHKEKPGSTEREIGRREKKPGTWGHHSSKSGAWLDTPLMQRASECNDGGHRSTWHPIRVNGWGEFERRDMCGKKAGLSKGKRA